MATISTTGGRTALENDGAERCIRRRHVLLVDDDASIQPICSLNLLAAAFERTAAA